MKIKWVDNNGWIEGDGGEEFAEYADLLSNVDVETSYIRERHWWYTIRLSSSGIPYTLKLIYTSEEEFRTRRDARTAAQDRLSETLRTFKTIMESTVSTGA